VRTLYFTLSLFLSLSLSPLFKNSLVFDTVRYVTRTTIRNGDWNHEEMLWRSGIEVNPLNSKLHGNLGSVLMRTNRFDEARYHLNQSVRSLSLFFYFFVSQNYKKKNQKNVDRYI